MIANEQSLWDFWVKRDDLSQSVLASEGGSKRARSSKFRTNSCKTNPLESRTDSLEYQFMDSCCGVLGQKVLNGAGFMMFYVDRQFWLLLKFEAKNAKT